MSIWSEFLDVAELLLHDSIKEINNTISLEALIRCSISRSYYGAFCSAREYKNLPDIIDLSKHKKGIHDHRGSHQVVIDHYFMDNSNVIERKIGLILNRLKRAREDSDYRNPESCKDYSLLTKTNALILNDAAKQVLKMLSDMEKDDTGTG